MKLWKHKEPGLTEPNLKNLKGLYLKESEESEGSKASCTVLTRGGQ